MFRLDKDIFCCCCKEWHLLTLPLRQRQVNRSIQLVWRTRQRSEWWHNLPPPYSIIWRGNVGAQRHGVHLRADPGTLPSPQSLGWKSAVDCGFVRQESLREQFGSVCVLGGQGRSHMPCLWLLWCVPLWHLFKELISLRAHTHKNSIPNVSCLPVCRIN